MPKEFHWQGHYAKVAWEQTDHPYHQNATQIDLLPNMTELPQAPDGMALEPGHSPAADTVAVVARRQDQEEHRKPAEAAAADIVAEEAAGTNWRAAMPERRLHPRSKRGTWELSVAAVRTAAGEAARIAAGEEVAAAHKELAPEPRTGTMAAGRWHTTWCQILATKGHQSTASRY